jgi:hypothetical protein
LMILSAVGIVRPVGWALGAYLQGAGLGREVMVSGASLVVALFSTMPALTRFGPLAASSAVGITFAVHAVVSAFAVRRASGPAPLAVFQSVLGPFLACLPMVFAVRAIHAALVGAGPMVALAAEIAAGALAYPVSALVLARAPATKLVALARDTLARRRAPAPQVDAA